MSVFHVFQIVPMATNRATHHTASQIVEKEMYWQNIWGKYSSNNRIKFLYQISLDTRTF